MNMASKTVNRLSCAVQSLQNSVAVEKITEADWGLTYSSNHQMQQGSSGQMIGPQLQSGM